MIRIPLFRQCRIWLPTFFGWFVLFLIFIVTSILLVSNIYSFLAQNEPIGAHILVVEGWVAPEELDQAVQSFKKGGYDRVVTTGGPILEWAELSKYSNYAKMAADYLAQHGIPRDVIIIVPTPKSAQDRTFLSAVMFRESAQRLGIKLDAIDIFSSGSHARRSRLLFQMALGQKANVGIISARPSGFDPEAWWRSSMGVEEIIFQSIGFVWVKCCFWPEAPGSQNELWGGYGTNVYNPFQTMSFLA